MIGRIMDINTIWNSWCADEDFVKEVQQYVEASWIAWEDWELIEVVYNDSTVELDVFAEYETRTFLVYPTFLGTTLVDLTPLRVRA